MSDDEFAGQMFQRFKWFLLSLTEFFKHTDGKLITKYIHIHVGLVEYHNCIERRLYNVNFGVPGGTCGVRTVGAFPVEVSLAAFFSKMHSIYMYKCSPSL